MTLIRDSSTSTRSSKFPKDKKDPHPAFAYLPELEGFAKSDREKKLLTMFRTFRLAGFRASSSTRDSQRASTDTSSDAMRKTLNDPAFHKEFQEIHGDDATPLIPEEALRESHQRNSTRHGNRRVHSTNWPGLILCLLASRPLKKPHDGSCFD